MSTYKWNDSDFAEDRLPPGQDPIHTSSVRRFMAFIRLITDPNKGYPTMGLVTGSAGLGKTVAIQAYLEELKPRAHTGLPGVIKLQIKPRSTPKALALDVVAALRDKPRGRNIYQVSDGAADAIERNDLTCIIVDEADRLNEDSFEVLRYLFDKTGCPIVVVGLPSIESVIDRHEKFKSRVGLRMEFLPVEREEMLETVLPNLVFPRWKFDPGDEDALVMGKLICDMVGPSLRKLRNLLQIASQMARHYDEARITSELITEAFRWAASKDDKRRLTENSKGDHDVLQGRQRGAYERLSEIRHEARK